MNESAEGMIERWRARRSLRGVAVLTDDPRKGRILMTESVKNEALQEFRRRS